MMADPRLFRVRRESTLPFGRIVLQLFRILYTVISLSKQRVLVTGGAGFIGSELVRQLAGQGFAVQVVDNLVNGRRENLDGVLGEDVELAAADIRDQQRMAVLLRDVDIVFHLACLGVRHSIHSPIENHEVNAPLRLVCWMRRGRWACGDSFTSPAPKCMARRGRPRLPRSTQRFQ